MTIKDKPMAGSGGLSDVFSDKYMIHIHKEIEIAAPAAVAWEALLEQIGPGADRPDGQPMPMKLEAFPGGRWYRDMGNNTGHFWGHVQVIKPPSLLEICGPLFMSYPAISHVQYRLTENSGATTLALIHRLLGDILPEHRAGMTMGWNHILSGIQRRAAKK